MVAGEGEAVPAEAAAGWLSAPASGGGKRLRAEPSALYDAASLTKPLATAACAMKLTEAGDLDIDGPAWPWLPELPDGPARRIRFRHLLGHASGLPAHVPFYRRLWMGEREGASSRREALLRMAARTPLEAEPGRRVTYSDLGFILLGFALERIAGARLDALASRLIFSPLGMASTRYVDLDALSRPDPVAPTELCPVRGLVRGEVHDENAHAAGGVCGHAGVFSTARDVATFARALCRAAAGDENGHFAPEIVRRFFGQSGGPASTWRLGWDTPAPEPGTSSAGDRFPRTGVGHLGFTGTSLWLHPDSGRYVVILANRVHPTRERLGIRPLRRALMDAAWEVLAPGSAPL